MMKQLVLKLALVFATVFTLTSCEKEELIQVENLPTVSTEFLNEHFKDVRIVSVKKETEALTGVEYDVVLGNGIDITFDAKGEWKEVEARIDTNPLSTTSFILTPIVDYVDTQFPEAAINGIEKEKTGFDVELTNGLDLKFDLEGNYIRLD